VKLGPGGIREIEFIVQALQIVRGGREPGLRVRGTQAALGAIAARRLLPEAAVATLRNAYVLLRSVEHRLQYRDDRQTQSIPADLVAELARLGASGGYRTLPALSQQRVDELVPRLLSVAAIERVDGASAQTVFKRLFGLLEAVSRRSAYLALLIEHPPVLPRL